jgi:hypothetical protein
VTARWDEGPWVDRLAGAQRCTYGTSPGDICGQPAVLHILADDYAALACAAHTVWWTTHECQDTHPIGGECGLPGTVWIFGTPAEPGRCVIDGLDLPCLFATEAELIGATS